MATVRERTTTLRDQQAVNVTIYNDGNALVHDRRSVFLDAGLNRLAWRDVSASMDPTSALLDSARSSGGVSVLEQNFDYNVLDPNSLLHAYIGQWVTVVHPARFKGGRETRERARILSLDNGIVLQYANRIETQLDGRIVFPSVPASLRDRPTLTLDLESARRGRRSLDLRYLTHGLSWRVNYVGTLSPDESTMTLEGLVTLSNSSGTSYRNARLQLVAGNIHEAVRPQLKTIATVRAGVDSDIYSTNVTQQNYFEYHLYTLHHATTILNKQTKQLMLLTAHNVPVTKTFELNGGSYYYNRESNSAGYPLAVGVYVSFVNRGGELGIPLPAGIVRIYQNDAGGVAQYLGSDSIVHTPRNQAVSLHLGNAFDITARARQTDFHMDSKCESTSSYEIDVANAKDTPQKVRVDEPMPGQWTIERESAAALQAVRIPCLLERSGAGKRLGQAHLLCARALVRHALMSW